MRRQLHEQLSAFGPSGYHFMARAFEAGEGALITTPRGLGPWMLFHMLQRYIVKNGINAVLA